MKPLISRGLMLLVAVPLMFLAGCAVDIADRDWDGGYYHRGYDGYYSRGYYQPGYYAPRRGARVVVEPRVRVYAHERW